MIYDRKRAKFSIQLIVGLMSFVKLQKAIVCIVGWVIGVRRMGWASWLCLGGHFA